MNLQTTFFFYGLAFVLMGIVIFAMPGKMICWVFRKIFGSSDYSD